MQERLIQKGIVNYLQLQENIWKLYFFRSWAWAVRVSGSNGRDRMFKTGKAGCPDVTVCKPVVVTPEMVWQVMWQFTGLEVKNEKGRQSESQKKAQERIEKAWGEYHIVRSLEEVISLIE